MIKPLTGIQTATSITHVLVEKEEVYRVNRLLETFQRYVEHIIDNEGINYSWFHGKLIEGDPEIINSIAKGDSDD